MAFSAKQFSIFLLLTLFSSLQTHARDSQFFNKIPSTTNDVVAPVQKESPNNQPQQQDPTFLPEKENAYGLYGHESGQNPPSTAAAINTNPYNPEYKQPPQKYLPKNYNPVAYVTQPEDDINYSASSSTNNNNYFNGAKNYYNNPAMQGTEETEFRNYPATETNRVNNNNNNGNYYYNGASSEQFTTGPTRYGGSAPRGGGSNRFQQQGMSDTRFLNNGQYFYDINAEKEINNRPYDSVRGVRTDNDELYDKYSRNFNENNAYENNRGINSGNSFGGYQNNNQEDDFQNNRGINSGKSFGGYQNNNQEDDFQDDESLP